MEKNSAGAISPEVAPRAATPQPSVVLPDDEPEKDAKYAYAGSLNIGGADGYEELIRDQEHYLSAGADHPETFNDQMFQRCDELREETHRSHGVDLPGPE